MTRPSHNTSEEIRKAVEAAFVSFSQFQRDGLDRNDYRVDSLLDGLVEEINQIVDCAG